MKKQLQCGAGKLKITPPEEWLKNLRGLQNIEFTSVLDDLFVRVLALDDGHEQALIISFDLDKVPHPKMMLGEIERYYGIPEDHIILVSIHTHSAPVTGNRINEGPNDISKKPQHVQDATKKYECFLMECMMDAVGQALVRKRPARITYGTGRSYINVHRIQNYFVRNEGESVAVKCGLGIDMEQEIDRTLFVMKVDDLEGENIGFFLNYPMHNCVMIQNPCGKDGTSAISADVGGAVCRYLEEAYSGSVALWTSGAAGDINPIMGNEVYYPDIKTGEQTRLFLQNGETAKAVLKTLSARQFADVQRTIRDLPSYMEDMELGGRIVWIRIPARDLSGNEQKEPYEVRMHLLKIGNLALIGASGELYSSLGAVLKDVSRAEETVVINHEASLMVPSGYIFDDETLARDREGSLPGRRSCVMAEGYIKEALKESCQHLEEGMFSEEAPS